VVGLDYPYRLVLASGPLTTAIGQVAILGLMALTIRRRPTAWKSWLFFVITFTLYLALSGYARVASEGSTAGLYYDHLFYGPYLFVIAIALALAAPARGVGATTEPKVKVNVARCNPLSWPGCSQPGRSQRSWRARSHRPGRSTPLPTPSRR